MNDKKNYLFIMLIMIVGGHTLISLNYDNSVSDYGYELSRMFLEGNIYK